MDSTIVVDGSDLLVSVALRRTGKTARAATVDCITQAQTAL
eukprot:SAG11_NODE_35710_length_265_cov_0.903614_1_plen_40_part_01